jgi:hypothetical protein
MSFNRNLKRVAGPSFVINVRFDDHQMMRCRNNTNTNPLLAKGRRLDEVYDVKEQEFLVALKAQKGAHYMDGYTHCFSSANNFSGVDPKLASVDAVKDAILDDVRFVGVASTEYVPSAAYQEQGFVAQVGGVVTVTNESHDTIYPGDKVMLDVALRRAGQRGKNFAQKGVPAEKIRFTIKRAMPTPEMARKAAEGTGGDALKIVQNYQALQERVVGKSFTYARHGDRLEINLQPRSSY